MSLEKYFSSFLKVGVTWMQHQCKCELSKKSTLFLEKSLRMCLKLGTCLNNFSEHFFREGILFEIFLERQNNISYTYISSSLCYFGDKIGQLCAKEAGQELMKSIFIWRFDLSLEIDSNFLNSISLLWVLKAWMICLFFFFLKAAEGNLLFVYLLIVISLALGQWPGGSTLWQQNWEILCSWSEAICWRNCPWEPPAAAQ